MTFEYEYKTRGRTMQEQIIMNLGVLLTQTLALEA